jgi:hypothetical protein
MEAISAGKQVESHEYEFNIHVFLETGDERCHLSRVS